MTKMSLSGSIAYDLLYFSKKWVWTNQAQLRGEGLTADL